MLCLNPDHLRVLVRGAARGLCAGCGACRGDSVQPFEEGRRLAAGIPGARFVALEGRNHVMLEDEPAWTRFRDEVQAFLRPEGPAPRQGD